MTLILRLGIDKFAPVWGILLPMASYPVPPSPAVLLPVACYPIAAAVGLSPITLLVHVSSSLRAPFSISPYIIGAGCCRAFYYYGVRFTGYGGAAAGSCKYCTCDRDEKYETFHGAFMGREAISGPMD